MMPFLLILIVALVLVAVWAVAAFNRLISLRNRTEEAWSDIDVQMKRRYDLIPNLVASVKGYATHEASVFENVTKARTAAMGARTATEHAKAENQLTESLKTVFAVAENYPQLQASQNFLQLQNELADAEDKIQAARRFYNGNARDFNTALQTFPSNMIANMMQLTKKDFFEAPAGSDVLPEVKF